MWHKHDLERDHNREINVEVRQLDLFRGWADFGCVGKCLSNRFAQYAHAVCAQVHAPCTNPLFRLLIGKEGTHVAANDIARKLRPRKEGWAMGIKVSYPQHH